MTFDLTKIAQSRVITFADPSAVVQGNFPIVTPQSAPPKDINDDLNYLASFARIVGEGVSISQAYVSVLVNNVADTTTFIESVDWLNNFVMIRIAGGTANTLVTITVSCILSDGEEINREFILPILNLVSHPAPIPPGPPSNVVTLNGVPIRAGTQYICIAPGVA